jgi:hypothetical protein
MFSVRVTPWHGLGAVLDQPPATIAEAIEASGLGWGVAKEPIAIDRGEDWQLDALRPWGALPERDKRLAERSHASLAPADQGPHHRAVPSR